MLKHLKEIEKYVEITGFRNVKIKDKEKFVKSTRKENPKSTFIQLFDARLIASWQHLYFATLNALLAFKNGRNISRSVPIEILLYASAQRQIQKAIKRVGVKSNSVNMAIVIIGKSPETIKAFLSTISKRVNRKSDETVLELIEEKIHDIRNVFEITEAELETITEKTETKQAIVNLIIERMALLSTEH